MSVDALWLEVGAGGGEHALAQANTHRRTGFVAAEVYENGLCSLLARLIPDTADPATAPLPANLRLWPSDARILIQALPDSSLDALFLLFPDPWPKARHAKRRFVHPALLPALARVLRPGAEFRIATDDPTYQDWVAEVMAAQPWFAGASPFPVRPENWPPTRYEAKALAAGRRPLYWRWMRVG